MSTPRLTPLLLTLFILAACGSDQSPTAPAVTAFEPVAWRVTPENAVDVADQAMLDACGRGATGYPLQLGNQWKYEAHVSTEILSGDGGPIPAEILRTTKAEIVGSEPQFGRCYVLEEQQVTEDIDPDAVLTQRVYYRQDRSGLYEADIASGAPVGQPHPAGLTGSDAVLAELTARAHGDRWAIAYEDLVQRAACARQFREHRTKPPTGGALDNEITRLDYPLHRGKTWMIRNDDFDLRATVLRRVVLPLPVGRRPAWCMQLESSLFDPDDEVLFYYGRDGYLGSQLSVVADVTDNLGNLIGRLRFNDEEFLEDLAIDRGASIPCTGARAEKPRMATGAR